MPKLNTTYDIVKAIKAIEDELIASMIQNMDNHRLEETKENMEWSQWQVEQLAALAEYKKRNAKKYNVEFEDINDSIDALISMQRAAGNSAQEESILKAIKEGYKAKRVSKGISGEFFKLNDRKINALIEATKNDFQRGEIAILRRAEDQYRQVIFNAQMYAATRTTYEKAIDMATKDFLSAGINCIEYANGARHTLADYADMALRTAQKRAYLTGEGEMRQEWGISTVIMNKRTSPCPKCLPFVERVLVDDVWSGGRAEGAKYPLMSKAIEKGLYHPRCRDSHTTYFEGISTPPDNSWSKEELKQIEANTRTENELNYAKRQEEKYSRLSKYSLDKDNKRIYKARADGWKSKAEYIEKNHNKEYPKENMLLKRVVSLMPKKVQERLEETIVDLGKKGASQYDYINDIMYIAENANETAVIHEIGHMVENKLLNSLKVEALKKKVLKDVCFEDIVSEIYYDAQGNEREIYLIKSKNFVSEYQGRLYIEDISEIFDDNMNIRNEILADFMAEPFREYIQNPDRLRKEFPEFYSIIEEALK